MAAASDKARYFLEQSVPELKELERKKIFNAEEINSIVRKRSDFEHKINARGSTATDYARYAEFEINVDSLRRKRMKRLSIKVTNHTGQRRIFFVFDRGTRKHPGDVGLWLQSIEYAKKQRAYKKLSQIFTNVLRLHPARSDLWIYAAQYAVEEHGDMTEARGYMQRGLRFCKSSKNIWLEYTRLEMSYMAKIHARRQILGISKNADALSTDASTMQNDENVLQLPKFTMEDISPQHRDVELDDETLRKLDSLPILRGAIPTAIFDAAIAQFKNDLPLAYEFFDLAAEYDQLEATPLILQHIHDHALKVEQDHWTARACHFRLPLVGVSVNSPGFPAVFREFLHRLKDARQKTKQHPGVLRIAQRLLRNMLNNEDLDPAIRTISDTMLASLGTIN